MTRTAGRPSLVDRPFLALFAASLAFFVAGGIILPIASPFATEHLGSDAAGAGVAIGAFAIAALVMRPVVGWASDRFGRRPLLVGGAIVSALALTAHLAVDSLPGFVLVRAIFGGGEAFFFVAAIAGGSDLAPPERRGEAINLISLSLYLGIAVGPPIGEAVLGTAGFSGVWIVAAAITGLSVLLAFAVPESAPGVVAGERGGGRLLHPAALFPGFLIFTGAVGMGAYFAFLPLHVADVGLDGSGLPLAIYAALVVVLRIKFVRLPDTIGAARLSSAALVGGGIGLAVLGGVGGPLGVYLGSVLFAIGAAFMFPALIALAVARVGERERGSAVGTASVFLDLAFGLGPAVMGVAAQRVGFGGAFLLSAAISVAGGVLLFARRRAAAPPATTVPAGAGG